MVNRNETVYPRGSNKGFSSSFYVDSWVRSETPEEGRRTYQVKCCEYNNKDEVNSSNILSNNNNLNGQSVLFDPQIGPYQVLPFRVRVGLEARAMKGNTTFP